MTYPFLPGLLSRAIQKAVKARKSFSSQHIFRAGRTDPLYLSLTLATDHNIMRRAHLIYGPLVPKNSSLHHSFNPPRPTAPRSIKLDVSLRLWYQQVDFCLDYSNSIPALTSANSFLLNYLQLFLLPASYSTRVLSFRPPLKHCWNLSIFSSS